MKRVNIKNAGFALIEALVALAVVSLGSMGLAGVQMFLARNGDLAVQRTQASILADSCIEALRAYAKQDFLDGENYALNIPVGSGDLCPTQPLTLGNEVYTVKTFVNAVAPDVKVKDKSLDAQELDKLNQQIKMQGPKAVTVRVSWTDRAGERELNQLDFRTVIARRDVVDPSKNASSVNLQKFSRTPSDRQVSIPSYAVSSSDGKTSSIFLEGRQIIFDNLTGAICATVQTCSNPVAYYLEGYIKQIAIPPTSQTCTKGFLACLAEALLGVVESILRLLGDILGTVSGFGMNYSAVTVVSPASAGVKCYISRDSSGLLAVVSNLLTALTADDKFFYYKCIIPFSKPGPLEEGYWGGKIRIGFNIRSSTNPLNYLVCRYQYTNTLQLSGFPFEYVENKSNVQPYKKVSYILMDQNYLLITGAEADIKKFDACPLLRDPATGRPQPPLAADEVPADLPLTATLVKHQRCVGSLSSRDSTECPGVSP